jgi:hypothetical protein
VCIDEVDTAGCQSIDIRRFDLGVSLQATNPIIQIINRNKQHVGMLPVRFSCVGNRVNRKQAYLDG